MARQGTHHYRRTVHCVDDDAHGICAAWLDHIRRASGFLLGRRRSPAALQRRATFKLQCGSLLGMGDLIEGPTQNRIDEVTGLLRRALARYGSFERVPMAPVIRRVRQFERHDDASR